MSEQITMFCTKYALTGGIKRVRGYLNSSGEYLVANGLFLRLNKEAFVELADAINNAEKRRLDKIASLHKQITKLDKVTFDIVAGEFA